jgi:hypothetical protein
MALVLRARSEALMICIFLPHHKNTYRYVLIQGMRIFGEKESADQQAR